MARHNKEIEEPPRQGCANSILRVRADLYGRGLSSSEWPVHEVPVKI